MTGPEPTKPEIRRVVILAKMGTARGIKIAAELGQWLQERGVEVRFDRDTAAALGLPDGVGRNDIGQNADLLIGIGGDGTLLSAARSAGPLGVPILGINFGSLGFLTELQPDESFAGLKAVLSGNYTVEERRALRVRHLRGGTLQSEYAVLNDAVLAKSTLARMILIEVRVDDEHVATYTSDGLIVSTPTGSTAYSLSAGGPILDPRMSAFVITPICPHTMTHRPLVVPGSVRVEIFLRGAGEAVYLTLDGQIGLPFENDDSLTIDDHPSPVRLVRVSHRPFFEILRRKLRWGER